MEQGLREPIKYCIFDPTGNITALAERPAAPADQPAAAAAIMRRHPAVEQVGFVRVFEPGTECVRAELRMAGGEFCGNAAMCAGALCLLNGPLESDGQTQTLRLRVSGAVQPVTLRLRRETESSFRAELLMPPALGVEEADFSFEGMKASLPLVRMQGISHLLITPDSPLYGLQSDRAAAGRAVRAFCAALGAEGLGLMFLSGEAPSFRVTPLVYIPGSGTLFWENSCASGSAAVATAFAARRGAPVELTLEAPGGILRAACDPGKGETWLCGRTRLIGRYEQALF